MSNSTITTKPEKIWQRLALVGWALIALAFIVFYLIDMSLDYQQLLVACEGLDCNYLALSPAEVTVLESWGLSTQFYSLVMIGVAALTVAVFWLVAGLILWRQPDFRIGLGLSLALLAMPVAVIADAGNVIDKFPDLLIPTTLISTLGIILLLSFLYLLPNGRFFPRWAPVPLLLSVLFVVFANLGFSEVIPLPPAVMPFALAGFSVTLFMAIIFQILRYFRFSTSTERLQTRWVMMGLIILMIGAPVWAIFFGGLFEIAPGQPRLLASMGGWFVSQLAVIALPITVAIAILRYRLWDIDLIIRKTLIYLLLTATLMLLYLGFVVLLQSLFGSLMGERYTALVTVASTLAVAALFNPLRRRIQNLIDRRFFRQKYDKEQVLASFTATLSDEVDLDRLGDSIVAVVYQTMQPESISLWLRDDG